MPEFDEYKDIYHNEIDAALSFSNKSQSFFTKVKAEYILQLIDNKLSDCKSPKILDVGCGHGDIHHYLKQSNPNLNLTGIDVATSVIEDASAAFPENSYLSYDGERIPFEDDSFDCAYTICVMHHVPPAQWQNFLSEMHRVVRPGGLLAVFEHNPYNPLTLHIVNNCPLDKNAVLLKPGKLSTLAKSQGWHQLKTNFILFTPFEHPVFKKLDKILKWLPLGAQYFVAATVKDKQN